MLYETCYWLLFVQLHPGSSKSDPNSFSLPFSMSNVATSTSSGSSDVNMHYYTYLLHAAQQQRQKEQQQEHHKQMMAAMALVFSCTVIVLQCIILHFI
jgi:uncharacterized membrane protein